LDRGVHRLAHHRPEQIVLHRVVLPFRSPFATAHGVEAMKEATIVEFVDGHAHGWGECVALGSPDYTSEYADGAFEVLDRFLAPAWIREGPPGLDWLVGHPMAKASMEFAAVDLALRCSGDSLASSLGATRDRVPAGVVVGLGDDTTTLRSVAERVDEGYRRVKLKINAHTDVALLRRLTGEFPAVAFAVDANGSLSSWVASGDPRMHLLDSLGLQFIEQPLAPHDFDGHARLGAMLATPICLDESLTSLAEVQRGVAAGACRVVNLKPGRVGGLGETIRIHDWCSANDVGLWVGGMLETGIGRALNVAVAALDGFSLPGDLSASSRYFETDFAGPLELDATGCLRVPTGPGIGVEVDRDLVERFTIRRSEHAAQ
jgi:o-succinylbenzoate synthase